jgi:hypothetical protein
MLVCNVNLEAHDPPKIKQPPTDTLKFRDSTSFYKSASLHFSPANDSGCPLLLAVLNEESSAGPLTKIGAYRQKTKTSRYAATLSWTVLSTSEFGPLPFPPVVLGFVACDIILVAVSESLVLCRIVEGSEDKITDGRVDIVASVGVGLPISHGCMLQQPAGSNGEPFTLLLVHSKTIVQSCTLAVGTRKRPRRSFVDGDQPDAHCISMTLSLLSSFATHEIPVHDVDVRSIPAQPARMGRTQQLAAFVALETGAVIVLELQTLRLLHHIAHKRSELKSRVRIVVSPGNTPSNVSLAIVEGAKVYVHNADKVAA